MAAVALSILGTFPPADAYVRPGHTELVGYSSGAGQYGPAISDDGRYVAYTSVNDSPQLGDVNGVTDVFRRDRSTGRLALVSVGMGGLASDPGPCVNLSKIALGKGSMGAAMSADGRYVVFESCASNLVPGDTNLARDIFVRDLVKGTTQRVNVDDNGLQMPPGSESVYGALSANGRFVVFNASGLGSSLASGTYRRDLRAHKTELVTVGPDGVTPVIASDLTPASMSGNGRLVVFSSSGTGFTSNGPATRAQGRYLYLRDMTAHKTTLLAQGDTDAGQEGTITENGRYVVFESSASGLVPNDVGGNTDVFRLDRRTGRITRVDVTSSGEELMGPAPCFPYVPAFWPAVSPDGRFVAFTSDYPGCTASGEKGYGRFLYDTAYGEFDELTVRSDGTPSTREWTGCLASDLTMDVSRGGRFAAFDECYGDLTPKTKVDGKPAAGTFVRDHGTSQGVGALVASGRLSLAGSGSFPSSGIASEADPTSDLNAALTDQGANLIGASVAYRPQYGDLFVREELQDMPSVTGTAVVSDPGILYAVDFTSGGRRYEVRIQRVPGSDFDVAGGASFGLFERDPATGLFEHVASLRGGYGTTGKEVVFSLPLADVGLSNGGRLRRVRAFTAIGSYDVGAVEILDMSRLQ